MLKRILKRIMTITLTIISLLVLVYLAFTNFYPSFGADISKEKQLIYQKSTQYKNGKFNNKEAVPKELSFSEKLDTAYYFFTTKVENGRPKDDLKVQKIDSIDVAEYKGEARLVWFGHSAFLLQIDGKTILLDPMFGKVAAPHPLLGADRFNSEMPIAIEKLPFIDAVIFSHDHYDHLDYETVMKIKDKTKHFYTPLGVGEHLKAWGIPASKISELDWWKEIKFETLTLVCTPAQHFSGRKLNNEQSTLWSSWVIRSKEENIFFSGDSGYSPHFKEIGNKYGPFDLALMECGQYNDKWSDIHMIPEETAQAGMDVRAKKIMPIHWGGFKLAMHDWKDPINRVKAKAKQLNLEVITPKIGQEILVKGNKSYSNWWENL